MTTKTSTPRIQTRDHLLQTGRLLVGTHGFTAVGLKSLLDTAKTPKGSFYHYFQSKEAFGVALLQRYTEHYLTMIDGILGAVDQPAYMRLLRYWQSWHDSQTSGDPEQNCLVVKLSAEIADLSTPMREELRRGTDRIIERIALCIEEGIAEQTLTPDLPAFELAELLYQHWLGASLLDKLRCDGSAFRHALTYTQTLLAPTPHRKATGPGSIPATHTE